MKMKYGNRKVSIGKLKFDSKAEAERWNELVLLQRAGNIKNLRRQQPFELIAKQKGERAVNYIADFVYVEDGVEIVEEVKSKITKREKSYIIKRKLFKQIYGKLYEFREEVR